MLVFTYSMVQRGITMRRLSFLCSASLKYDLYRSWHGSDSIPNMHLDFNSLIDYISVKQIALLRRDVY